ncbi:MAG: ribonuclease E activity regulator RraA [Polyangiales bacterium]
MVLATTDLSDAHSDVQIAEPLFRDFGGERAFFGPIATLKVFEDNALVREALESQGEGRVLVVDGAGSLRCALVGGNLAALAEKNGWSGIVVFGAVRDTRELATAKVGVKALAPHPKKSIKKGAGERDVPVTFAGVTFNPGAWLYADEDGIIVSESRLDG